MIAIPSTVILMQDTPTYCCDYVIPKGHSVDVVEIRNKRKHLYFVKYGIGFHLVKGKYLRG